MKKRIISIILMIISFQLFNINVNAASASATISVSTSNTVIGNTGTATLTISSDEHIGQIYGTFTCEVKNLEIGTLESQDWPTASATPKTIKVVKATSGTSSNKPSSGGGTSSGGTTSSKKEYSANNFLNSLEIEGNELNPKFNKETTEYKLTVDQSIEKIKVNASAEDKKASVAGTGEINLSPGENTIEIKVTAENGNEKKYKIVVSVEDLHPIKVIIDKTEYTIVKKNNNLIDKLEHYEETTTKIDEQDVIAYTNKKTNTTLILLKDKENAINYYIYNEKDNKYEKYEYIKINNITIQLLNEKQAKTNFKKYETTIGEVKTNIYKLNKKSKTGLIYGVNVVTGNKDFYLYDEEEQTISRYYSDEIDIYKEETLKYQKYLLIAIATFSLVIIITIICSIIKTKKNKTKKRY